MPVDGMSPVEKFEASRLIELFLRLVSADDVRQLVFEMEEELAKPIHLSVVRTEKVPTVEVSSNEAAQTASAPDLLNGQMEVATDTKPANPEFVNAPRATVPPPL
jgi:hypothetical protein